MGTRHRAGRAAVRTSWALTASLVLAGCTGATRVEVSVPPAGDAEAAPQPAAAPAAAVVEESPPAGAPPPPVETTTTAPPPRVSVEVAATPFAVAAGLALVHPSSRVERVGFHQSNHDGAQPMEIMATAAAPMVLPSRDRDTGAVTAADVVADPVGEILAPVTGTVKRGGGYVLYCKHRDEYLVIAPDDRSHLEVKLLHITGVRVRPGDRLIAGETVVAAKPTPLPFASQVDEFTATPAWPHVHVEVVDPSVRDRPSPGGGCH